jgi:hypothetical protein
MPYPMSHLYIAENVMAGGTIKVNNVPQYYLGSLGPDAVHFRKDYNITYKRNSHLYEGLDKIDLDIFINNWKDNVETFFIKNKPFGLYDFLLGYCLHLLADIYNYKYIWTPFKHTFGRENDKIYQNESMKIDQELFRESHYEEKLFPLINESEGIDFFGLITKDELNELKNNILHVQYNEKQFENTGKYQFTTYNQMREHNSNMVKYISDELKAFS